MRSGTPVRPRWGWQLTDGREHGHCVDTRKTIGHKITNTTLVSRRSWPADGGNPVRKGGLSPLTLLTINGRKSTGILSFVHSPGRNRQKTNSGTSRCHQKRLTGVAPWVQSIRDGAKTTASNRRIQYGHNTCIFWKRPRSIVFGTSNRPPFRTDWQMASKRVHSQNPKAIFIHR